MRLNIRHIKLNIRQVRSVMRTVKLQIWFFSGDNGNYFIGLPRQPALVSNNELTEGERVSRRLSD
jgi:hypothetical protein